VADEDQAGLEEPPVYDVSGEIEISPGSRLSTTPLPPGLSTPLDDHEPEGTVPPAPLWAMKDRRHFFGLRGHGDVDRIRKALGAGDDTVYFIDDGHKHCMIGRQVGAAPDGSVYCLVGRIRLERYEEIESGEATLDDVFADARDITLCSVFVDDGMASEIVVIQHYPHFRDVPADYLPPSPFIQFDDDLPENG
jgi:hypothetical protein